MIKPKLLDLFCGAGGCTRGYQMAGFQVTGVDINPQPRYIGDAFWQADAMSFLQHHGKDYDVIHASPPCQGYSKLKAFTTKEHPMLISPLREILLNLSKPYIIENVIGAPLTGIVLCGTMFNLKVYRHRIFESNFPLFLDRTCRHIERCAEVGRKVPDGQFVTVAGHFASMHVARKAMGIDWMNRDELAQSIPPSYTLYIGQQIMALLQ